MNYHDLLVNCVWWMILFWAKQAQISSSVEFTLMMPIAQQIY